MCRKKTHATKPIIRHCRNCYTRRVLAELSASCRVPGDSLMHTEYSEKATLDRCLNPRVCVCVCECVCVCVRDVGFICWFLIAGPGRPFAGLIVFSVDICQGVRFLQWGITLYRRQYQGPHG